MVYDSLFRLLDAILGLFSSGNVPKSPAEKKTPWGFVFFVLFIIAVILFAIDRALK